MKYIYIVVTGTILTLIGLFVYFARKKRNPDLGDFSNQFCKIDSDCKPGQKCFQDPSNPTRNICAEGNMKKCEFLDFSKLTSCDPLDKESCKDCLNQPPFGCVVVSFGKPVLLTRGRNYQAGYFPAVRVDPSTNVRFDEQMMDVMITVTDTANGVVDSVVITHPRYKFNQGDTFVIVSGNQDATFSLTEQPSPYMWQKGTKKVVVPESETGKGWCLPPVNKSIKCNPYTSDSILVQEVADDGKVSYAWGCYCKLPSFMQHGNSPISNCSALVGCGGYDLYIPPFPTSSAESCLTNTECSSANSKCCDDEKCLSSDGFFSSDNPGTCYTKWKFGETERSPMKGTCDCPRNYYFQNATIGDYVLKSCNTDACEPMGTKIPGTTRCACKPGKISCGLVPGEGIQVTDARCATKFNTNRCLDDPCAPGGTMRQGGGCNCDISQNYVETDDLSVVGGKTCKQLCVDNGSCGVRGTCKIEDGTEVCTDCICPWAQKNADDKLCSMYTGQAKLNERCRVVEEIVGNYSNRRSITYGDDSSCCGANNHCVLELDATNTKKTGRAYCRSVLSVPKHATKCTINATKKEQDE